MGLPHRPDAIETPRDDRVNVVLVILIFYFLYLISYVRGLDRRGTMVTMARRNPCLVECL